MIRFIKYFKRMAMDEQDGGSRTADSIATVHVLFVCMGNICRSPTAEGVFRKLVETQGLETDIAIDSAGTISYHVGEPPDNRAQEAARQRDIDLSTLRARQIISDDFHQFDYIIAMDDDNLRNIQTMDPGDGKAEVSLLMDFAPQAEERVVPDPYYGGSNGFQRVLDLIEQASIGLLAQIRQQKGL